MGARASQRFLSGLRRALPGGTKRFWVLILATGAIAGLGAVALLQLLRAVQNLAWPSASSFLGQVSAAGPLQRLLVPASAGVLVTLVSLLARAPLGGHGTAGIIEAIWVRGGRLPLSRALVRSAVSITAVGLGASLGREGPLVQTGAAAASWLGEKLRIPIDQVRLLVACGAAAGIAAAYNVPIGAALFGLEVLLGSLALELFGPIVVCCVTATLLSRILVHSHPSYVIPDYRLGSPQDLLLGFVFGPVLGVASALYVRAIDDFSVLVGRLPRRLLPWLPTLGLLLVGVIAIWFPQILGNGYDTVNDALFGRLPLLLLFTLPLLKLGATALCAGVGVPGGLFTPSLFFGALLGGALGKMLPLAAGPPPGAYALLGMGAILAGTTHAAISAVLIIFELTGDYGVILPLMVSCVTAAAVSRRLEPHSLYTAVLFRRKIQVPELPRPRWLRGTRVGEILDARADTVPPSMRFGKLLLKLLELPTGRDLYVVGEDGRLLGTIVLEELKSHIPDLRHLEVVNAADVMNTRLEPLTADTPLSEAARRFAETTLGHLPVVDDATRELRGTVSKSELLRRGWL